jgi:hypothetical protein
VFAKAMKEKACKSAPAYERLYDAPAEELSFEAAEALERASWRVTAQLVGDEYSYEENEQTPKDSFVKEDHIEKNENSPKEIQQKNADSYGLCETEIALVSALSRSDYAAARRISDNEGGYSEIYERINEAFFDNFGDVILEESDDGFIKIIDDYSEEIDEWLLKISM